MTSYAEASRLIRAAADPERARFFQGFFRTGPGGYGEGDVFLGLTVPDVRAIARKCRGLPLADTLRLLRSKFHEGRLLALIVLGEQYKSGDEAARTRIFKAYLSHRKHVNNWDLVDTSAPHIVGSHLLERDRGILDKLASAKSLWDRRIAMLATFAFIRSGELEWTFRLAERFLDAPEDLMHKAAGWMLREAGKRDERALRKFLDRHAAVMPRTMLRYSLEKLPVLDRKRYMAKRAESGGKGSGRASSASGP